MAPSMKAASSYGFRIRFQLSKGGGLAVETPQWEVTPDGSDPRVWIESLGGSIPITDCEELILRGESWKLPKEAEQQARTYWQRLRYALAALRIGVSFGDWGASGGLTEYAISEAEKASGLRIRNDLHGIQIVPAGEKIAFVRGHKATIVISSGPERIREVFDQADFDRDDISSQLQLSFDLFNASFFQDSPDTRLVLLVMSVEALLEPKHRSKNAIGHVDQLLTMTRESTQITETEKASLIGSLRWLRKESFRQSGRRLVKQHLAGKTFNEKPADRFFSHCYTLRSDLVHGKSPRPSYRDVSVAAANLEFMVSELLTKVYLAG